MTVLRSLPRWVQLLLIAIAARALVFGNPVSHVDEAFYWVTADAWLHGALPYVDIWDRKPIGLFLLYLPAAVLGYPAGIWAYQALALAAAVGTAVLVARLAERAGWEKGALAAGAAYLLGLDFLEGQGGQAPVFYNLLMAGAATLLAPRADDAASSSARFGRGLAAMALVGAALQVKYSVVFEGLFFGLWWLWRELRLARLSFGWAVRGAALAGVALLPTVLAWGAYAALGHGQDFVYANFLSIGDRRADGWAERIGNLALIVASTLPLLVATVLAWRVRGGLGRPVQDWLFAWLLAAVAGLLVFGSWFNHYALPLLVPLSACAAGFAAAHRWRRATLPMLVLAFVAGQGVLVGHRLSRGSPAQFARVVQAVGRGSGCLYVYSGETMLYPATGRCRLSRWVFPSHLGRVREQGAIGVDQEAEIRRILAARPAVVVVRKPYRGERPEMRALVMAEMAAHYRVKAQLPLGNDSVAVFERR